MAKQKEEKTNVMRILEQKKIQFTPHQCPHEDGVAIDGVTVATLLNQRLESVFKTLVARGVSRTVYIFVIPVAENLDLKKAAKATGEKSIDMVAVAEITALTGYVRGGCSPIGMKKNYPVLFHESTNNEEIIIVSAGKIGYQVELASQALVTLVRGKLADLIVK